jgi:dienelactone hydrolase
MRKPIIFILLLTTLLGAEAFRTVSFPSADSLTVTGDLYLRGDEKKPFIILFHRARWSRGEYREIAPRLNKLGYRCLAVDQRSGDEINGVVNETAALAARKGLSTDYLGAYGDMRAALDYVVKTYHPKKIIVWGSSYSASLVFRLAAENPGKIHALLAFSPGEYMVRLYKSDHYIRDFAARVNIPVFVTSAKNEENFWTDIFAAVKSRDKVSFLPGAEGFHGCEALWPEHPVSKEYWPAVEAFLEKYGK